MSRNKNYVKGHSRPPSAAEGTAFKCKNMTYAIYFWIAAYYAGGFIEGALPPSAGASVCGIALRIAYWGAFFIFFASRGENRLSDIGMTLPGRAATRPAAIVLYAAAPAAALCAVLLEPGACVTLRPLELAYRICADISAAAMEELIFRGVILLGMLGHLRGENALGVPGHTNEKSTHGRFARIKFGSVGAVVASAGLFSAAHLPNLFAGGDPAYTLLQAAFAFCAGVSLGALSVCSGSILPSVILHAVINLSSVVTETAVKTARSIEAITLCGLAALYLAAGIFILHRQKKRVETS